MAVLVATEKRITFTGEDSQVVATGGRVKVTRKNMNLKIQALSYQLAQLENSTARNSFQKRFQRL